MSDMSNKVDELKNAIDDLKVMVDASGIAMVAILANIPNADQIDKQKVLDTITTLTAMNVSSDVRDQAKEVMSDVVKSVVK
jgi:hypothetical protein